MWTAPHASQFTHCLTSRRFPFTHSRTTQALVASSAKIFATPEWRRWGFSDNFDNNNDIAVKGLGRFNAMCQDRRTMACKIALPIEHGENMGCGWESLQVCLYRNWWRFDRNSTVHVLSINQKASQRRQMLKTWAAWYITEHYGKNTVDTDTSQTVRCVAWNSVSSYSVFFY